MLTCSWFCMSNIMAFDKNKKMEEKFVQDLCEIKKIMIEHSNNRSTK